MSAQPHVQVSPVERAWTLGRASGITWASWLDTPLQDVALTEVAKSRESAVYGRTLDYVLRDFFDANEDRRLTRAFASGVLLEWQQETDSRADAAECCNCSLRVLTDLEEHFVCPAGDYGVTCSEACRDEICRFMRCGQERDDDYYRSDR